MLQKSVNPHTVGKKTVEALPTTMIALFISIQ
jgi:hypothetical protein